MPGEVIMSMSDRQRQGEDLVATHGDGEEPLVPRAQHQGLLHLGRCSSRTDGQFVMDTLL